VLQVVDARAAELSSFVTNSVNAAQIETLVATKVGILMTLVQKYDYLVTLVLTARVQDEPLGDEWNSLIYSVFLDAMSAMPSLMLKGTGFVNNPLLLAQTLFIFKDYVRSRLPSATSSCSPGLRRRQMRETHTNCIHLSLPSRTS